MNTRLWAVFLSLLMVGCIQRPVGPGERIGRGIDEIAGGLQDMESDPNYRGDAYRPSTPQQDTRRRGQADDPDGYARDARREPPSGQFDSTQDQYWDEQAQRFRARTPSPGYYEDGEDRRY